MATSTWTSFPLLEDDIDFVMRKTLGERHCEGALRKGNKTARRHVKWNKYRFCDLSWKTTPVNRKRHFKKYLAHTLQEGYRDYLFDEEQEQQVADGCDYCYSDDCHVEESFEKENLLSEKTFAEMDRMYFELVDSGYFSDTNESTEQLSSRTTTAKNSVEANLCPHLRTCTRCQKPLSSKMFSKKQLRKSADKSTCLTCVWSQDEEARVESAENFLRRLPDLQKASQRKKNIKQAKLEAKAAATKLRQEKRQLDKLRRDLSHCPRFTKLRSSLVQRLPNEVFSNMVIESVSDICVSSTVVNRFLGNTSRARQIHLSFHGTNPFNHQSIFSKGFLIPGKGIKVLHGSAHGVGIYTSLEPGYSMGYTYGSNELIVCGVIQPENSDALKQVGNILVAFNASLVCPLFKIKAQFRGPSSFSPSFQLEGADKLRYAFCQ